MEPKTTPPQGRAKRPERASARPTDRPHVSTRPRYSVIVHGDVVDLVDSEEQPDIKTAPGERRKMIVGAFADKDKATKSFERYKARARGIVGRGEPR
jgi:hypothetical protein